MNIETRPVVLFNQPCFSRSSSLPLLGTWDGAIDGHSLTLCETPVP